MSSAAGTKPRFALSGGAVGASVAQSQDSSPAPVSPKAQQAKARPLASAVEPQLAARQAPIASRPVEAALPRAHDFSEDARGLRALADANGDLKTKREWFAGEAPTYERVSEWPGIKCANGRIAELQVQVSTLPDAISKLAALTSLDLSSSELTMLPETLGDMSALTCLKLNSCNSLTALPTKIGECRALSTLNLGGCKSLLSLPESIGNLKGLKRLDLWHCKAIKSLPRTMGNLTSLQTLTLRSCEGLLTIPDQVCDMPALQALDLSGCPKISALPSRIADMPALKKLDVKGCVNLLPLSADLLTRLRNKGVEVVDAA